MALDAKVTVDDNALFRHPDVAEMRDLSAEDPQERMAKERGLTYVKLDGNVGILGNGAGLVMSTLDVVAQAGGSPANFLDAGGGSKAEAITSAVEVILSDEKVKAVLFNIFGGITRCDEVARGLIEAFEQIKPDVPFVVRLDGTNDKEGRALLAEANLPNVHTEATMLGAAEKVVELAALMAILVDRDTRLVVSGITGPRGHLPQPAQPRLRDQRGGGRDARQGRPGRGGHPRLQHLPRGGGGDRRQHGDGVRAAARSPPTRSSRPRTPGIALIITITEGIPAHDELRVYNHLQRGELAAGRARTARASSRPARRTWGSSRRSSSRRATSGWCRAPARSPTRSATSWPSAASATRRSSASAATRCRARASST